MKSSHHAEFTQSAPTNYAPSVPMSVYRELAAELRANKAVIDSLNSRNQQLVEQNQRLKQEIQTVVQATLNLGQFAGVARSAALESFPNAIAPDTLAKLVKAQSSEQYETEYEERPSDYTGYGQTHYPRDRQHSHPATAAAYSESPVRLASTPLLSGQSLSSPPESNPDTFSAQALKSPHLNAKAGRNRAPRPSATKPSATTTQGTASSQPTAKRALSKAAKPKSAKPKSAKPKSTKAKPAKAKPVNRAQAPARQLVKRTVANSASSVLAPAAPAKLFTEQSGEYRNGELNDSANNEIGGIWLVLSMILIIVTAFGAGFLIMKPLLNDR